MELDVALGVAVLGVTIAQLVELLRLYTGGQSNGWPPDLPVGAYAIASGIRLALGALVAFALFVVGLLCNEGLALLAGLSTLKVIETLLGYTPAG